MLKAQTPAHSPALPKPAAAPADSASPAHAAATAKKNMTASDYIRQHPNVPASDLVVKGKRDGFTFSRNLVYLVRGPRSDGPPKRSAASKASKPAARRRKARRPSKATAPVSTPARRLHTSDEAELAKVILSVGFDRAEELIGRLRRALG
jgi:hypothetical protein